LFGGWAYCSADGGATVRRLELEFSRLEPHEGGVREVYRPKRRSIFAKAKEYIRLLQARITPLRPSGLKLI